MDVVEAREGDITILAVTGRLDSNTAKTLEVTLLERIGTGAPAVLVDFAGLDYISSAGLRVLLLAAKRSKAAQSRFALCSIQPHVREVFEISGFSNILSIHPGRSEAMTGLA